MPAQVEVERAPCAECLGDADCTACRTFVCDVCRRRVTWAFGCADDMPGSCDDCWTRANVPHLMQIGEGLVGPV